MFNAPLGDSSTLLGTVAKLMDEGLDAGEKVSKRKRNTSEIPRHQKINTNATININTNAT